MNCVFCKIVSGTIPCYKIYEDKDYLAFLDISHFVPGHTLVIPKKHIRYIWDIIEIAEYFKVIQKIGKHFINKLGYQFVDTLSFGRLVPHAHMHLLPHNSDNKEYAQALFKLFELQTDGSRRLTKEKGIKLADKFKLY